MMSLKETQRSLTDRLPAGSAPEPVSLPHFPDRLYAYVWRNWTLVPLPRIAEVVGATEERIRQLGHSMGLADPSPISKEQWRRSYITIIRRNWHLLPYEQLLSLLGWSAEEMAYTLQEDDFLFIKLGQLKPKCLPLCYESPNEGAQARAAEIAALVRRYFPDGLGQTEEPLFGFIKALSRPLESPCQADSLFSPRFCTSYFTLYGDPLLDTEVDAYPDGYLARLAASGVDGVWMQAVLYKLTPFPWDPAQSNHHEERLENLRNLVARARRHGIGIYLYLNEPRSMPLSFFEEQPELKGVVERDSATMCTGVPAVQKYLRDAVAFICERVSDLAGFFTITASENLTNCWSHGRGSECPRCHRRGPETVIAEVNTLIREGITLAESPARLIAWDWGWQDRWIEGIVSRLPHDVTLMSVSEWSIPIERGGTPSVIGEYSISEVGPGPRATRSWTIARERGLRRIAKIQANNTWELSSVPYIPAVENVTQHALNIRRAGVDGLMLGWTLGGYPSPNLEAVAEMGRGEERTVEDVMHSVATARYGSLLAPAVVEAWHRCSAVFREFPYHGGVVYNAPQQMGPANLLWETRTGYHATMVGLPYDDLDRWRAVYPPEVFIEQFRKVADGFNAAAERLRTAMREVAAAPEEIQALRGELDVMEACAIHFRSVAHQAQFILTRDALDTAENPSERTTLIGKLAEILRNEIVLALRLYAIQSRDSRLGFEASNHYFYVPTDLAEKVLNCEDLLSRC